MSVARGAESDHPPPDRRAAPSAEADPVPAAWFRSHVEAVWRLVARLGVPAGNVDDVVQEVFITAARRRTDIRGGQERSFLLATAIRLAANHRQRAHVRREVQQGDGLDLNASPEPDAEQLLIEKRWRELLERVLSTLSDAHRAVFVLYELEGLSIAELAELLRLPVGTVSSRLQRARVKFLAEAARVQRALDLEGR